MQFDPQAMHASLDLLMSYRPTAMYLTHYSQVVDVAAKAAELHRLIDAHLDIARREKDSGPDRHSRMRAMLAHLLVDEAKAFGCQRCRPAQSPPSPTTSNSTHRGSASGWTPRTRTV